MIKAQSRHRPKRNCQRLIVWHLKENRSPVKMKNKKKIVFFAVLFEWKHHKLPIWGISIKRRQQMMPYGQSTQLRIFICVQQQLKIHRFTIHKTLFIIDYMSVQLMSSRIDNNNFLRKRSFNLHVDGIELCRVVAHGKGRQSGERIVSLQIPNDWMSHLLHIGICFFFFFFGTEDSVISVARCTGFYPYYYIMVYVPDSVSC